MIMYDIYFIIYTILLIFITFIFIVLTRALCHPNTIIDEEPINTNKQYTSDHPDNSSYLDKKYKSKLEINIIIELLHYLLISYLSPSLDLSKANDSLLSLINQFLSKFNTNPYSLNEKNKMILTIPNESNNISNNDMSNHKSDTNIIYNKKELLLNALNIQILSIKSKLLDIEDNIFYQFITYFNDDFTFNSLNLIEINIFVLLFSNQGYKEYLLCDYLKGSNINNHCSFLSDKHKLRFIWEIDFNDSNFEISSKCEIPLLLIILFKDIFNSIFPVKNKLSNPLNFSKLLIHSTIKSLSLQCKLMADIFIDSNNILMMEISFEYLPIFNLELNIELGENKYCEIDQKKLNEIMNSVIIYFLNKIVYPNSFITKLL